MRIVSLLTLILVSSAQLGCDVFYNNTQDLVFRVTTTPAELANEIELRAVLLRYADRASSATGHRLPERIESCPVPSDTDIALRRQRFECERFAGGIANCFIRPVRLVDDQICSIELRRGDVTELIALVVDDGAEARSASGVSVVVERIGWPRFRRERLCVD